MGDESKASVQNAIDDPAEAVKRAFTPEGRNTPHLGSIMLLAQDSKLWPELRAAGIINLIVELFVDGWHRPESEAVCGPWIMTRCLLILTLVWN